jgi:hypothetical protein
MQSLTTGKTEHGIELQLGTSKLDFFIRQQHLRRIEDEEQLREMSLLPLRQ